MSYILSREKEIVTKEVLEGSNQVYTKCWSKDEFLMTLEKEIVSKEVLEGSNQVYTKCWSKD